MQILEVLIAQILPYLTLAVLVIGLIYRIRKWHQAAVANMALYPAASTKGELWRKLLSEVLLFKSFREENRSLWATSWTFHLALAVIIVGHSRLITDWPLRVLLGMSETSVHALSAWSGGIVGVVAMVTCLVLIGRRHLVRRVNEISTGEDFGAIYLLLLILLTGNYMRFFAHFDVTVAQAYFASLFTLGPIQVPQDPMFLLHFFLVQVLLVYLPFGKLLHIPGVFYSKQLVLKDY